MIQSATTASGLSILKGFLLENVPTEKVKEKTLHRINKLDSENIFERDLIDLLKESVQASDLPWNDLPQNLNLEIRSIRTVINQSLYSIVLASNDFKLITCYLRAHPHKHFPERGIHLSFENHTAAQLLGVSKREKAIISQGRVIDYKKFNYVGVEWKKMSPTKIRRALAQMLYHFGDITNSFPSELNVKIGSHLVLELSQELDSFKLIKVVLEKMDAKTRSIVMLRLFNQFTPTQNDIDLQTRMEFEQTQKELDTLEKIGIRQFMNHLPLKELSAVTPSVAKRLHQTLSDELHLAKEANPMLFFNYKTRRAIVSELGQCAMIDTDKPVALRFREALARAI